MYVAAQKMGRNSRNDFKRYCFRRLARRSARSFRLWKFHGRGSARRDLGVGYIDANADCDSASS